MSAAALLAAAALAAAAAKPAAPKPGGPPPGEEFIARLSSMVAEEPGADAGAVREQDRRIEALSAQARSLGYRAAPALAAAAADARRPFKLRLWLIASLQSLDDPAAFDPLSTMALDPATPDLLREAALRGAANAPVSIRARRQTLCGALALELGPASLSETLFELRPLGCELDGLAALEKRALPGGARADWAIEALSRSLPPAALDCLDRVFARWPPGSPERLSVARALRRRPAELAANRTRWSWRAQEMLSQEARSPENAAGLLALIGAVGDPGAAATVDRYLADDDGRVALAAADALAALHATRYAADVRKMYDGFLQDPRFETAPGFDAIAAYDRLGAALRALTPASRP